MCLDVVYRGKQKKEALAKLPESGYYYKVVTVDDGKYYPICKNSGIAYKAGENITKRVYGTEDYAKAYHLFKSWHTAEKWFDHVSYEKLIKYKVDKKDIIHIGKQSNGLCIVTTRFWCPKPKKSD